MSVKLDIKKARLSFANGLFRASSMEPGQQEKFGADFIIGPDTEVLKETPQGKVKTTIKAAMLEVANETWKGKGQAMLDALEASKKCYRDGNLKLNKAADGDDTIIVTDDFGDLANNRFAAKS